MICGRDKMDEFCILCMREDILDCYNEEYSIELNDIKMFVNLSPEHKRLWI